MTDREFESMLRKEETHKEKARKKEEKRKKKKQNIFKIKGKKGQWQNDKESINSGEEVLIFNFVVLIFIFVFIKYS